MITRHLRIAAMIILVFTIVICSSCAAKEEEPLSEVEYEQLLEIIDGYDMVISEPMHSSYHRTMYFLDFDEHDGAKYSVSKNRSTGEDRSWSVSAFKFSGDQTAFSFGNFRFELSDKEENKYLRFIGEKTTASDYCSVCNLDTIKERLITNINKKNSSEIIEWFAIKEE